MHHINWVFLLSGTIKPLREIQLKTKVKEIVFRALGCKKTGRLMRQKAGDTKWEL